jgi:hypothetical protein
VFTPQLDAPLATQDVVTPVIDAGTASAIDAPLAVDGPLLLTTIV